MKKRIEGVELLQSPPTRKSSPIPGLIIPLAQGLNLTEQVLQSPLYIQGAVGTGKSTLLYHDIAEPILAHTANSGDTCVFFIAKPEALAYRRPGDYLVSFSNTEPESCWCLFEDMRASKDPYATAREIAATFFSEAKEKTTQRFFPQSAQELFYHTLCYLYDCGKVTGECPSNKDLVDFLSSTPVVSQPNLPGWIELSNRHPQYFSCVRDYIGTCASSDISQGLGILGELRCDTISEYFVGSFAKRGSFSVRRAMQEPGKRIFVQFDFANAPHASLTLLGVLMELIYRECLRPDRKKKTYLFLDEAHLLPKSSVLADVLSFGRDPSGKKLGGVRIIMATQSAMLFTKNYTETEARTLLSLFPNVISFRVSDPISRAVISDRYGEARYQESIIGAGGKPQIETFTEKVVSDYQFSKLTRTGQAIISMPEISESPFFYDGYREDV